MECYSPLTAFQTESGGIVFSERGNIKRELTLRCGQCIGCRLERSRQWAVRCMHESQMHASSVFVTLTYNDDHLPNDSSLFYPHYQLFMKRLRRSRSKADIRFYMCGEYGEFNNRPHYHACLFGVDFPDMRHWRTTNGIKSYRSEELEKLWKLGHCEIGHVTFESAAYVARYCTKKVTGAQAEEHYKIVDSDTGEIFNRMPEFARMSLNPAIGKRWFEKYKAEVFPLDRVVVRGHPQKPPKYYKVLLDGLADDMSELVDYKRYEQAIKLQADNSYERLNVKRQVTEAAIKSLKRSAV